MRILILCHSFNTLSQYIHALLRDSHTVSVEYDINDRITIDAVRMFRPDIVLGTFLRRRIPESVWRNGMCWIIHPGPPGERGPHSIDRAILDAEPVWGVTVLQATDVLDGGPVWASKSFRMRHASKLSIYNREVCFCAGEAVAEALERYSMYPSRFRPWDAEMVGNVHGWRPALRTEDRRIDWSRDTAESALAKIHASDSVPGCPARIHGKEYRLYHGLPAHGISGPPGEIVAIDSGSVCISTKDGAVWVGLIKAATGTVKRPAAEVLSPMKYRSGTKTAHRYENFRLPEYGRIHSEIKNDIAYVHFPVPNGALSTRHCNELIAVIRNIKKSRPRFLVLCGGFDSFCNGIDLRSIEASDDPASESHRNIIAVNDLVKEIILATDLITVAAMRGHASAGGAVLSLACDLIFMAPHIVLNYHYRNMGGLYGSEYWTYLLPRRCGDQTAGDQIAGDQTAGDQIAGDQTARELVSKRLPLTARQAKKIGLCDEIIAEPYPAGNDPYRSTDMLRKVHRLLASMDDDEYEQRLRNKQQRRIADERNKPLDEYRNEEMRRIDENFFGFDTSYHVARYHFVHHTPRSHTPLHLALHRRKDSKVGGFVSKNCLKSR